MLFRYFIFCRDIAGCFKWMNQERFLNLCAAKADSFVEY